MNDRRSQTRLLCADLIVVEWQTKPGRPESAVANLEDISPRGVCLQMDCSIPVNSPVRISYGKSNLDGTVRYCAFREIGYYLGVEFAAGQRWTKHKFKPQHIFDPRRLSTKKRAGRQTGTAA